MVYFKKLTIDRPQAEPGTPPETLRTEQRVPSLIFRTDLRTLEVTPSSRRRRVTCQDISRLLGRPNLTHRKGKVTPGGCNAANAGQRSIRTVTSMRQHGRTAWGKTGLGATLLLAVLLLGGASSAIPPMSTHSTFTSGSSPAELIRPASQPNGNLSILIPQPTAQIIPGMYLIDQFRVTLTVTNSTGLPPVLNIWVPQTIALFNISGQPLKVIGPTPTLNFSLGGPYGPITINATALVKIAGSFNTSIPALLTSQLLSFMSNAPDGSLLVSVNWRWAIAYPDGSSLFSPWSSTSSLEPGEYADLASYGPIMVPTDGWFQVCMDGSAVSREYSLHLETLHPVDDFVQVEQNISAGAPGSVCWSAQVASWVTPQPILAHVWAYDQKTFLLYLIKITVVNQTGPFGFLSPWITWNAVTTIGALAVAAGLVVWGVVRFSSSRRASKPEEKDGQDPEETRPPS